ncbi:GNAT family N-acetyltransferase [Paenibacillus bouchesdurhonensis]|uniref:GNAT family N-acetyltransferase n=1 Tax=Paenibacillus bouchesdurhonensis TaxID=1870990 RepID=UPI001F1DF9AA|nr:GNAT family N-acetyltransferase [Paenibacillus bouchesdurhonensis]
MEHHDIVQVAQIEIEISVISFGRDAVIDPQFHIKKLEKASQNERKGMLILEVDESIGGWMWITPRENSITKEKYANFKSFYIAPDLRGTRYVEELFEEGIAYCRREQVEHIVGKVHVENLPMRLLYKKYGFRPMHLTMELSVSESDD